MPTAPVDHDGPAGHGQARGRRRMLRHWPRRGLTLAERLRHRKVERTPHHQDSETTTLSDTLYPAQQMTLAQRLVQETTEQEDAARSLRMTLPAFQGWIKIAQVVAYLAKTQTLIERANLSIMAL